MRPLDKDLHPKAPVARNLYMCQGQTGTLMISNEKPVFDAGCGQWATKGKTDYINFLYPYAFSDLGIGIGTSRERLIAHSPVGKDCWYWIGDEKG